MPHNVNIGGIFSNIYKLFRITIVFNYDISD